jgi:hypothetical protein
VIDDRDLGATETKAWSAGGKISRRFCYFQEVAAFTSSIQVGTRWQSSWKAKPHLNPKSGCRTRPGCDGYLAARDYTFLVNT